MKCGRGVSTTGDESDGKAVRDLTMLLKDRANEEVEPALKLKERNDCLNMVSKKRENSRKRRKR